PPPDGRPVVAQQDVRPDLHADPHRAAGADSRAGAVRLRPVHALAASPPPGFAQVLAPHHSSSRGATMKTRHRVVLALGLAAVLAAGGFVASGRSPADGEKGKADEKEQPAKERRAEFIAAYDKGDAKAVAAFWMPDAVYVDEDGREYKGREAIQ